MTPVPPGGVPAAMLGDSQLSVQEKTSLIFAKLDGPYVGVESFKACFASAGFNLSEATIEDMFVKIQRFGDNLPEGLTFTDIQRVITVYPTLFNVMAFRMQDLDMDYRQIAVIDREGVILDELEETLKQLEGCTLEERGKIRALEAEQHELDEQLRAVSNDAKEKRRDLITQHEGTKAAKRELERSLETETAAKQVQALRDEELGLPQLRSTIDVKRAVLSAKQDSCKAINDSIADLEKKIQELKSDLFTATNDELAAINDVTDAEMQLDEQKQKCVDTDEHVRKAENTVQEKQQDLDECQRIEQETADKLKRLIDSEVLRAAEKETINVKLAGDIINIKQKEDETDTARQAYNDQVSRLNDMKTANENFRSLRAKQYAEEEVVIVQEIRLREQRESLELKEALLRNEVDRIVPHAHSPPNTPHRFHTPGSIPPTLPYAASPPGHSPAKPTPLPNRAELRDRMTDHAGR
eukprot:TRINITY_DN19787_c0_g1_i1.p1 TRINITY_DN19787_c0_g1~~TRINITY_DN19787_c0_g1_i1.p1  ORF type:complete len:486 (+),score=83.44 TRINITY_DN19787_c0_g1_i1:54-1460(+)